MATDLMWTTESNTEPGLFAGVEGREIAVGVMLAAGQGNLPRGCIVKEGAGNENWIPVTAAPAVTDRLAVLGRTTDTGESGATEDQLTAVYLSGLFNRDAISLGGGAELTAVIEETLRGKGIFMDCVIPASGPVPGVGTPVALVAAQADGSSGTASTKIDLTFDVPVTGITSADITLTAGTGAAAAGALTGSGTTWSLAITPTTAGTVSLDVSASGYSISGTPMTVTIFN